MTSDQTAVGLSRPRPGKRRQGDRDAQLRDLQPLLQGQRHRGAGKAAGPVVSPCSSGAGRLRHSRRTPPRMPDLRLRLAAAARPGGGLETVGEPDGAADRRAGRLCSRRSGSSGRLEEGALLRPPEKDRPGPVARDVQCHRLCRHAVDRGLRRRRPDHRRAGGGRHSDGQLSDDAAQSAALRAGHRRVGGGEPLPGSHLSHHGCGRGQDAVRPVRGPVWPIT